MGIFSGLLGNASKKDNGKVERQLENILIPGEQVELAYVLVRELDCLYREALDFSR